MNKQNDIQLSEHFSLSEFTKSITAERLGIDNKPGYEQVLAMRNLCREVLEPLRQHYGQPIRITSGYRCEELNSAVGGVRRSQHMLGEAADLSGGARLVPVDRPQHELRPAALRAQQSHAQPLAAPLLQVGP